MRAFGGGAGNQVKCAVCDKTVYPNDPQISLDGVSYHKECAKCSDCKCQITLANFCKFETTLFCKTHYFKRFKEEGSYLGGDKYAQKSGVARAQAAAAAPGDETAVESEASEASPAPSEVEAAATVASEVVVEDSPVTEAVDTPTDPSDSQATESEASPDPASTPEVVLSPEVSEEPSQVDVPEAQNTSPEEATPTPVTEEETEGV